MFLFIVVITISMLTLNLLFIFYNTRIQTHTKYCTNACIAHKAFYDRGGGGYLHKSTAQVILNTHNFSFSQVIQYLINNKRLIKIV